MGTYAILEQWGQPDRVCVAGLLHSVYSTDAFAGRLFDVADRQVLADIAGEDAERLAFLFGAVDRRRLTAVSRTIGHEEPAAVPSRFGIDEVLQSSEITDLLIIHVANTVEQACKPDGSPAPWLSQISQVAATLRDRGTVGVPPVLGSCDRPIDAAAEKNLVDAYDEALNKPYTGAGAVERSLAAASERVPWIAEPKIWLGLLALAANDAVQAGKYGSAAARLLRGWNAAWDKRLSAIHWLALANFLETAALVSGPELRFLSSRVRDVLAHGVARPEGIFSRLDAVGALGRVSVNDAQPTSSIEDAQDTPLPIRSNPTNTQGPFEDFVGTDEVPVRFAKYLSGLRHNHERPLMGYYPDLPARPWWDPLQFGLAADLERMASEIRAEFDAIHPSMFHAESERIKRTGSWNVFILFERGRKNEERCKFVPITTSIIESHRTVRTHGGLAYFSRMGPGTKVSPHRGPTNMRLRCHLGIHVPPDCGVVVGGIPGVWREGHAIVFDDYFTHEVWNASDRERVVLIVDLWHPDLSDDEVALLEGLGRHGIALSDSLERYWKMNEAAPRLRQVCDDASWVADANEHWL